MRVRVRFGMGFGVTGMVMVRAGIRLEFMLPVSVRGYWLVKKIACGEEG